MNIQLKQRLVGAVVLVSLAVIIIPLLLPGEDDMATSQRGSLIPATPDYRFAPIAASPTAPALAAGPPVPLEPVPEPIESTATNASGPHKKTQARPATKTAKTTKTTKADLPIDAAMPNNGSVSKKGDGQATAWVVQVGSFSRRKNAHALRNKLSQQGFTSFVEAVKDKSGQPVYRVRVGPEVRRDLADKLQQLLERDAQLTGIVLRYP